MKRSLPNVRRELAAPKARQQNVDGDLWLVKLFVLIRAAKEPVSEEDLFSYIRRRKIREVAVADVRRLLSSLAREGIVRPANGREAAFVATRKGRKAALEARGRLSQLLDLLDGKRLP